MAILNTLAGLIGTGSLGTALSAHKVGSPMAGMCPSCTLKTVAKAAGAVALFEGAVALHPTDRALRTRWAEALKGNIIVPK